MKDKLLCPMCGQRYGTGERLEKILDGISGWWGDIVQDGRMSPSKVKRFHKQLQDLLKEEEK